MTSGPVPRRPPTDQLAVHHVGISVTDADRSTAFYCDTLGAVLISAPRPAAEFAGRRSIVRTGTCLIDLNQFDDNDGMRFDPVRTGLDHLAFAVGSLAELEAWAAWLDAHHVARSAVRDWGAGAMVDFVDPDGIQIELFYRDQDRVPRTDG